MSDLIHKIIADLRAELEQQRTRAEGAEQELRDYTAHVAQSRNEDRSKLAIYAGKLQDKLAAARAHLAGVDVAAHLTAMFMLEDDTINVCREPLSKLLAAAREVLS